VPFGKQAAVRIDRQRTAERDPARTDELVRLAALAEPRLLELVQHLEREAVVDHRDVDVSRTDPGALVAGPGGRAQADVEPVQAVGQVLRAGRPARRDPFEGNLGPAARIPQWR
jgi:hypothetical protein